MKIGIDGSALIKERPTGVEVATRELMVALFNLDRQNQYIIYSSAPLPERFRQFRNVTNRVLPPQRFWTQLALPRAVNEDRPDVFWAPSHMLPGGLKCKTISSVHDLAFMRFPAHYQIKERVLSWLTIYRAARANKIIAVGHTVKADLEKYFRIPATQVEVIYHALPVHHQLPTNEEVIRRHNLPDDFVLLVGRVEPRKNPTGAIQAFAQIKDQFPNLHLVFAGPVKHNFTAVQSLTHKLGVEERVHFLGFTPQLDVFVMYRLSQAFLFPTWYEGFGIPILEAWAAHTPVVTTNFGAPAEVAAEAALLVDPGNPADIASKLELAVGDEATRQHYIRAGAERLMEFSWEKSAQQLKDLFEAL